jgi:hypothetical protein
MRSEEQRLHWVAAALASMTGGGGEQQTAAAFGGCRGLFIIFSSFQDVEVYLGADSKCVMAYGAKISKCEIIVEKGTQIIFLLPVFPANIKMKLFAGR